MKPLGNGTIEFRCDNDVCIYYKDNLCDYPNPEELYIDRYGYCGIAVCEELEEEHE